MKVPFDAHINSPMVPKFPFGGIAINPTMNSTGPTSGDKLLEISVASLLAVVKGRVGFSPAQPPTVGEPHLLLHPAALAVQRAVDIQYQHLRSPRRSGRRGRTKKGGTRLITYRSC